MTSSWKSLAGDIVAEIAGGIGLVDGLLQGLDLGGVFTADIYIGGMAAYGVAADDDALDQHVRITGQDIAVLEGRRFRFIGVDGEIDRFVQALGQEGPLQAGRKTCAATAAQSAVLDLVDDCRRFHGKQASRVA